MADDLVGIGGRLREGQVGDDAHAGHAHPELVQGDGLQDGGHAHAVGTGGLQHSRLRHGLVLRPAHSGIDA